MRKILISVILMCGSWWGWGQEVFTSGNDTLWLKNGRILPCEVTFITNKSFEYRGLKQKQEDNYELYEQKKNVEKYALHGWRYCKLPVQEGKITFSGIIEVPGVSKDQLYDRALRWIRTAYNKEAIEIQDRAGGIVESEGWVPAYNASILLPVYAQLWRKTIVEVKDGKYRYTIKDIKVREISTKPTIVPLEYGIESTMEDLVDFVPRNRNAALMKGQVLGTVENSLRTIKDFMNTEVKKSDW